MYAVLTAGMWAATHPGDIRKKQRPFGCPCGEVVPGVPEGDPSCDVGIPPPVGLARHGDFRPQVEQREAHSGFGLSELAGKGGGVYLGPSLRPRTSWGRFQHNLQKKPLQRGVGTLLRPLPDSGYCLHCPWMSRQKGTAGALGVVTHAQDHVPGKDKVKYMGAGPGSRFARMCFWRLSPVARRPVVDAGWRGLLGIPDKLGWCLTSGDDVSAFHRHSGRTRHL